MTHIVKEKFPVNYVPPESRLTFIRRTIFGSYKKGQKPVRAKGLYLCECGAYAEIIIDMVKGGRTISCGCYQKEVSAAKAIHGLIQHPLYGIWKCINQRCVNPNNPAYRDYGGRGVTVCDEWKNNFKAFYDWAITNGWKKGMEIDKDAGCRKLNVLMYSPETCSIVTRKENANLKRNNTPIEFNGRVQNLSAWALEFGVHHTLIQYRIKKGWPLDKALSPVIKNKQYEASI